MRLDFQIGIFLVVEQHAVGFKDEDMIYFVRDSLGTSLKELDRLPMICISIICSL